jgi:hypothetical protein
MTFQELIKKLKLVNLDEHEDVKFYCPINQNYYYIYSIDHTNNIFYITNQYELRYSLSYVYLIWHLTKYINDKTFKLIDHESQQEFIIP